MHKPLLFLFAITFALSARAQLWTNPATGIPSANITSITIDSQDKVWISTLSGIAAFEHGQWEPYYLNNIQTEDKVLNVWATEQKIWLGTDSRGLWEFNGVSEWKHFHPNIVGNGVIGFGKDSENTLWALNTSGTLDKWTGDGWEEIILDISEATDLFVDRDDNVWVLSASEGLLKYKDGVTAKWSSGWGDTTRPDYISSNSLYDMVQDKEAIYWIASNKGLLRFDGASFQVFNTANSGIGSDKARRLAIDKSGALWIGTEDAGISKYDGTTWVTYNTNNSPLESNIINSIAVDADNRIWIANGYDHMSYEGEGKGVFVLDEAYNVSQGRDPAAPTTLKVKVISENEVRLTWEDHADNEAGFLLERAKGTDAPFEQIRFIMANETAYADLTVTAANTYRYRIRATNSLGDSEYTNVVTAEPRYCPVYWHDISYQATATGISFGQIQNEHAFTHEGYFDYLDQTASVYAGQTIPLTVAFRNAEAGLVYIDWNGDGDFIDEGELVFRKAAGSGNGVFTAPVSVPGSVTPGAIGRLRVRAAAAPGTYYGELGPCDMGEETQDYTVTFVEPIPFGAPTAVTALTVSASEVELWWQDNASDEVAYVLERSTDGNTFTKLAEVPANTIQFMDTALKAGSTYYYRAYAKGESGQSEASSPAQATTLAVDFIRVKEGAVAINPNYAEGAYWVDYNKDGRQDLYMTGSNALYNNQGGLLDESNVEPFAGRYVTWGDYDNDGDQDAMTTMYTRSAGVLHSRLYENMGDGTFSERSPLQLDGSFSSSTWLDYDRDGHLDLFISYDGYPYGQLFKNNGDKTFSPTAKLEKANGDVNNVDYDNDGDQDLFVLGQSGVLLYENRGGSFLRNNVSGFLQTGTKPNGASWADFDNDGDLDVFVTNGNLEPAANALYVNNGDGSFSLSADPVFQQDQSQSYGSAWADYDNDGYTDLFVANFEDKNFLYRNNGEGSFSKVTVGEIVNEQSTLQNNRIPSKACAWADYNNDGFLDIIIANGNGVRNSLYKNGGNRNHWVNLLLVGTASNRSAIGARVQVKSNGKWQYHQVVSQTGFAGQNSLNVEFGLGSATLIDSLVITWPSGVRQVITGVSADEYLTIEEPVSYSLSGTVMIEDGRQMKEGSVSLFAENQDGTFQFMGQRELNGRNEFQFWCLPGRYKVQGIPDPVTFSDVAQGYWQSSLSLATATTLEITDANMAGVAVNLAVVVANVAEGQGAIEGVFVRSEGMEGGRIYQGKSISGVPVADAPVFLLDATSQKVIRQAVTDNSGMFSFSKLPAGLYQFIADYDGLPMHEPAATIEMGKTGGVLELTAVANQSSIRATISTVTSLEDAVSAGLVLFPNPFNDFFIVEMNNDWQGSVYLNIYDIMGRQIRRINYIKTHAQQIIQVNLESVDAGVYVVELSFNKLKKQYKLFKAQ